MYQPVGIPRVQSYRRLVEDIERPHETAAQRGTEVDALALATAQRIRQTVECEIAQTHVQQELDARAYFRQQTLSNLCIVVVELQIVKPFFQSDVCL